MIRFGFGSPGRVARQQGVILILTLWVLVILAAVALTYAYYARLDLQMTTYAADSTRARYLAKAGFYRACILLRDDKLKDMDLLDSDSLIDLDDEDIGYQYDAVNEGWYSAWWDEEQEDGVRRVPLGKGTFQVRVTDESGKFNLNTVPQEVLRDLLIITGVEEEKAEVMAAAIVDWRDEDDLPSYAGDEHGLGELGRFGSPESEDTFYNPDQDVRDIEQMGPQYVNKNAPFDNVEELLLVWGMDVYTLYGEDANGNGKLDPNERDGKASPPDDNGDDELLLGIYPYLTVDSGDRTARNASLNVNTASKVVLQACLMSFDESEAEAIAEDMVQYRLGSDDEPGTRDDRPIRTLNNADGDDYDLSAVRSLGPEGVAALQRAHPLGVSSNVFTIESIGEVGGVQRRLTAVVRRTFTEPEQLKGRRTEDSLLEDEDTLDREPVMFYVLRFDEEGV